VVGATVVDGAVVVEGRVGTVVVAFSFTVVVVLGLLTGEAVVGVDCSDPEPPQAPSASAPTAVTEAIRIQRVMCIRLRAPRRTHRSVARMPEQANRPGEPRGRTGSDRFRGSVR
jgi:hypothetical protein